LLVRKRRRKVEVGVEEESGLSSAGGCGGCGCAERASERASEQSISAAARQQRCPLQ
jgi:hypothetical protein